MTYNKYKQETSPKRYKTEIKILKPWVSFTAQVCILGLRLESFPWFYNKRYILGNGCEALTYGHYTSREDKLRFTCTTGN